MIHAPRPSCRGVCVLARVALAAAGVLILTTACSGRNPEAAAPATPSAAILEIAALPQIGPAPLAVEFVASLEGPIPDEAALACPSVAWSFGDGPAQIDALSCADVPQRIFHASHTYANPGAYEASVRLLAVGVDASYPLQIIVQGATATPQPGAVLGFPPFVLRATAAPDDSAGQVAGAPAPMAPGVTPSAPSAGAPAAVAETADLVLPADLYLLAGNPARVWRRAAAGGELEPVEVGQPPLTDMAVSAAYDLAVVDGGGIAIRPAGGHAGRLSQVPPSAAAGQERGATGASDLIWSPAGSRLAWRGDGVWVAAVGAAAGTAPEEWNVERVEGATGAPLAQDDRGSLLLRAADGQLAMYDTGTRTLAALPVRGAAEAGWLASGPVAWLAGPGLRLLTIQDPLQLSPLLDDAAVRAATEAPRGRLVVLVGQGESYQAVGFDLAGGALMAEAIGPVFALGAGQSVAWSANGAVLALAGQGGLEVVEPATGRRELLVAEPVVKAAWGRPGNR